MSTDYLHRDMADAAIAIGERIEPQINRLIASAFDEVMALEQLGDQRRHDALSLAFQLTAIMAAKSVILLGDMYPGAEPSQIWRTAQTDLQMRTQQALEGLKSQRAQGGRTVQ